jgi:tRNA(His) 5'-end guanylyltransferase
MNLRELEKRSLDFQTSNQGGEDFMLGLPIMLRLDGNNFSSFTKGLKQPYDERLSRLMIETCKWAVEETNARMGFVGSDEITLVLYAEDYYKTQLYYNRRKRKIYSILAGRMSSWFNRELPKYLPEKSESLASFDCRGWNVPNLQEACNEFFVREMSVNKNAITMACLGNNVYSHKQIEGKNGKVKQEMLFQKGINFNDYPVHFKRGVYVQRRKVSKAFTPEEISVLPEKHQARFNPNLMIERTEVRELELPIFSKITNQIDVVFKGEDALTNTLITS